MSLLRRLLTLLSLPHELAHLAVIAPWGENLRVVGEPTGPGGIDTPLAAAAADLPRGTPTWAVRACAVAPLVVYLGVAVGVELLFRPSGLTPWTLGAGFLLAFWASLSAGDLSVFLRPAEAVANGRLAVSNVEGTRRAASLLLVAVTVVVVVLFFR